MEDQKLTHRIKEFRNRKGFSQEELSEQSGLSLRTIQRIENAETEPRGDSLQRLAKALEVSPDELLDWAIQENQGYLMLINLTSISFILFPLLGFLIPFIMLSVKKDKIKGINAVGGSIVNFQITWNLIALPFIILATVLYVRLFLLHEGMVSLKELLIIPILLILYIYNLSLVIINSVRINNRKSPKYYPSFRFLRV